MGIYEFILSFISIVIVGIWGLIAISYKVGLIDKLDLKDDKKKNKKGE